MKILAINKYFYNKGGAETVFFQEREGLLEAGHSVVDFSMQHQDNSPSPYSEYFTRCIDYHDRLSFFQKINTAIRFVDSREAVKKISALILQEKPDIAHAHNIYHQLTPSIFPVLKKAGIPLVVTVHDAKLVCPNYVVFQHGEVCDACRKGGFGHVLWNDCQESFFKSTLMLVEALYHKWRKSYECVDLFLTPSAFYRDLISTRIPKNKIQVLPNGVDLHSFTPRYDHDGYMLYVGRLSREKGIETLLKAHQKLSPKPPLKIVGCGPLEATLRNQTGDVEFLGFLSGQSLYDTIRGAACVIVPSEWYENCSMVVLEAMSMGKLVIGSRIGGIPEQIEDGKTGMLFSPGDVHQLADCMASALESPGKTGEMGQCARQRIHKIYDINRHMEKLLFYYDRVLYGN
ncbi:glycosyltransferase family 4 protein [Desulfovibrio inopinatus]|uniref:glycosyltransferase family 4 protein n=1 Tax=Desulfovibrio inopinatus TaxID=102109 RepID=UPI0004029678|nr:glycosyltransferase family 4 protein [Desulfovibrio inopinatus]